MNARRRALCKQRLKDPAKLAEAMANLKKAVTAGRNRSKDNRSEAAIRSWRRRRELKAATKS